MAKGKSKRKGLKTESRKTGRRGSLLERLAAFHARNTAALATVSEAPTNSAATAIASTSSAKKGPPSVRPDRVDVKVDEDGVRRLVRMRPETALRTAAKMGTWAARARAKKRASKKRKDV